jgi:hypothetical protein
MMEISDAIAQLNAHCKNLQEIVLLSWMLGEVDELVLHVTILLQKRTTTFNL